MEEFHVMSKWPRDLTFSRCTPFGALGVTVAFGLSCPLSNTRRPRRRGTVARDSARHNDTSKQASSGPPTPLVRYQRNGQSGNRFAWSACTGRVKRVVASAASTEASHKNYDKISKIHNILPR